MDLPTLFDKMAVDLLLLPHCKLSIETGMHSIQLDVFQVIAIKMEFYTNMV
jgi:hypothetical protein